MPQLSSARPATRDPRDDYLVALAKAAGAVLVSSDRDLLDADIADLEVLSAREFLERLAWRLTYSVSRMLASMSTRQPSSPGRPRRRRFRPRAVAA